ncbi:MAG: HAMP domain-containing histidine kinase [Flavobacteriia bacterium]|nr:HAMP domain-containing histidine kinase [Flavobacteriia bacterium]
MKSRTIQFIVIAGFVVIAGILILQGLWLRKAIVAEQDRLDEDIHIALLEVVKELYRDQPLPENNPVKRISADYYAVNTEAEIDAQLLEYFLQVELERRQVNQDFEYAIYQCEDDQMAYGRYVSSDGETESVGGYFPKLDDYIYYFAVRFPNRTRFVASSLSEWILLTVLMVIFLGIYSYAVMAFSRQRRFSEMQRDFINTMAHEFKTPLASIQLASNYLSSYPAIEEDERAKKYAAALASSSDRLNSEVERILELGKVESNRLPLNLSTVKVAQAVHEVVNALSVNYPEVNWHNQVDESYLVEADEVHFKNILFNLLDNAAKYGGSKVSIQAKGRCMTISDNGPGISIQDQKLVFKKFYRSNVASKVLKGFGLGLYYVKQVADAHHWKVSIVSPELGGTSIQIQFTHEG